ncbi:SRPBCC family protein [Cylindrospermopsis raciborskii]|uniref:Cyclase n=1 Tax=Cylindrospermopsis raciborskii CENA302 TaxID=1170768 RepID=A0A9Q5QZ14_9CYAN|nr:SRPBCC family protein [Cylindrospermopsis raciborskii]MCZ2200893.1 cyclase [Cylindrospermopsis raciborskii PAMP2012]MCZ2206473.1 cyclase [Cylindrospermopsis raciborskii PAMP2011]NLQ03782.1 cyclase [Cylindrospermopsis raciborskii MVCC19]OHY33972.1 cyclase [Cylindrospermopsis raciborskii MVCC14]OPH11011.1 cyclase [Cylindrospermopsis raciborskii CENA302]
MFLSQDNHKSLMEGEILIQTRPHNGWGGAVTASMYLPLVRSYVWDQITEYARWVQYFPDLTKSELIFQGNTSGNVKFLYQRAQKAFLFFTAEVEIYLSVVEVLGKQIQFRMERGTFEDFYANLQFQDMGNGTLLIYTVEATPNIPIPSMLIEQGMSWGLPDNLRKMRQFLCSKV